MEDDHVPLLLAFAALFVAGLILTGIYHAGQKQPYLKTKSKALLEKEGFLPRHHLRLVGKHCHRWLAESPHLPTLVQVSACEDGSIHVIQDPYD